MKYQIRQGDVFMLKIDKLPEGVKKEDTKTVAYGEVTGHHHDLVGTAQVYSLEDQLFAEVGDGVVITHQEHDQLAVEKGLYEIRIQQEYSPEEVRRVLD